MPITRARKAELIESYKEMIQNSHAIVMARYTGVSVQELESLRRGLREADARIVVAKKTLMKRALQEMDRPIPEDAFDGPIGFVFLGEDIGAGAKALKAFIKEVGNERFALTGGILEDTILDEAGATALADVPTKDVMRGMLLGTLVAPMTNFLSVITAPQRDIVGILQARIDKEGGAGEAEAA